jgi:hypothetical protein
VRSVFVNPPPPKPEVILTNFFAEPTVLLVPITSREYFKNKMRLIETFKITCIIYCCIWSVTLAKSIVPRKTWPKLWHSCISKLFLTKHEYLFYLNINCILRQCMYIYLFHTYSDFIYIMFIWWFYFHLNGSGNRHKQNSRFCKEIREDNFRFWWRRVHEDAS